MADLNCLETVVRNATGKSAFFGYLPPHGRRLAAGETFHTHVPFLVLLSGITKKRQRDAFLEDLQSGALRLLKTAAPVYYDATTEEGKILQVANGVVSSADVCWGFASSA